MKLRAPGLLSLLATAACSTSLSATQTARTVPPGHVEMAASASVPISTKVLGQVIDLAEQQAGRLEEIERADRPLTEDEQRQALEAGLGLALFTPGVVSEISGRVGVAPRFDLGLRFSPTLAKVEAKYQLLAAESSGLDLAVGAGYGYHLGYGGSVLQASYGLLDFVKLSDYSRHDLEATLYVSRDFDDFIRVYGGLRYLVSFIALDADLARVEAASGLPHTELDGRMHYAGGFGGLMIGYKYLYLDLELTLMRIFAKPVILGAERDFGGFIVAPTLGLVARF